MCTKGTTTAEMLAAPGRMESAYLRANRAEPFQGIRLDDAITQCANRLRAIIDEHGPDAVAVYVSGQMSIEAQYLANKLTKGFIDTNQIESNSRLCMAGAVRATPCHWVTTAHRAHMKTSTTPTSISSSGTIWLTAIRSCSYA
ncbi:hypothetical protein BST45_16865 [Mycobacterium shinjukuense]|nr:molybdopterin-dependent oxidoreductase [Mycobacterium shinjukuense]ORB64051.1 hypothetical protein BST45_16865 [Mycobacterium shinjukuense]